jgi:acetylornithine deacetylase/succinyl-diaminopimelate desuccinylase-like protein
MDVAAVRAFVERRWQERVLPALEAYVAIPNQSPDYDRDWQRNGHMDRAVALIADWIRAQEVPDLTLDVVRAQRRTPLVLVEVPGAGTDDTVLLYGHLDKQPPMDGWREGLGAWTPVVRDGRLYGRGGADDGYAAFAAVTALAALAREGTPHGRCVLLIEASEESGSPDLPHHVATLAARIGTPSLVVCLDSGCGDWERLWTTTSLRGLVTGTLEVSTLREGVHSGSASGIVPSSFRVLRQLLDRLEDAGTGRVLPPEFHAPVPAARIAEAVETAAVLGAAVHADFPFRDGARPVAPDVVELLLNRTWRPQLEITGAAGLPPADAAGNVLRPTTAVRLSLRLPPTVDPAAAMTALGHLLEHDPPYGAAVRFTPGQFARGWDAPPIAPWLAASVDSASRAFFGREACFMGEGGTIPFMAMLGEQFPAAQFLITGVLGPGSNAHGPNEFLELETARRLTGAVAHVLADHYRR